MPFPFAAVLSLAPLATGAAQAIGNAVFNAQEGAPMVVNAKATNREREMTAKMNEARLRPRQQFNEAMSVANQVAQAASYVGMGWNIAQGMYGALKEVATPALTNAGQSAAAAVADAGKTGVISSALADKTDDIAKVVLDKSDMVKGVLLDQADDIGMKVATPVPVKVATPVTQTATTPLSETGTVIEQDTRSWFQRMKDYKFRNSDYSSVHSGGSAAQTPIDNVSRAPIRASEPVYASTLEKGKGFASVYGGSEIDPGLVKVVPKSTGLENIDLNSPGLSNVAGSSKGTGLGYVDEFGETIYEIPKRIRPTRPIPDIPDAGGDWVKPYLEKPPLTPRIGMARPQPPSPATSTFSLDPALKAAPPPPQPQAPTTFGKLVSPLADVPEEEVLTEFVKKPALTVNTKNLRSAVPTAPPTYATAPSYTPAPPYQPPSANPVVNTTSAAPVPVNDPMSPLSPIHRTDPASTMMAKMEQHYVLLMSGNKNLRTMNIIYIQQLHTIKKNITLLTDIE
jgi:hypothetical protein